MKASKCPVTRQSPNQPYSFGNNTVERVGKNPPTTDIVPVSEIRARRSFGRESPSAPTEAKETRRQKEKERERERDGRGDRKGWKLPARAGAGDKQPHGFHGSARRAKSALISGSRACRKRDDARRKRWFPSGEGHGADKEKGTESKNRRRRGRGLRSSPLRRKKETRQDGRPERAI